MFFYTKAKVKPYFDKNYEALIPKSFSLLILFYLQCLLKRKRVQKQTYIFSFDTLVTLEMQQMAIMIQDGGKCRFLDDNKIPIKFAHLYNLGT